MTFEEFQEVSKRDLLEQEYLRTESECLGILGDRMILEAARVNKAGEIYMETFSLVTCNKDGKIIMLEAFSDLRVASLLEKAAEQTT